MTWRGRAATCAAGLLALAVGSGGHPSRGAAQEAGAPALVSQRRALAILDRGIEATGGWDAVSRAGRYSERISTAQVLRGQEPRPGAEGDAPPVQRARISVDQDAGTFVAEPLAEDGAAVARVVGSPEGWWVHAIPQNVIFEIEDSPVVEGLVAAASFAPALLRAARLRAGTLRHLVDVGGPGEDVITFVDAAGDQNTLAFSTASGLLLRSERLRMHPLFGDGTLTVAFEDFGPVGELIVPRRIVVDVAGVSHAEVTCMEVVPGATVDPELLRRPDGAAPGGPSLRGSTEPFPGIHNLMNVVQGYNALWVELPEGVVVIEAPGDAGASETVLEDVASRAPDRPVTSLVLTHHHYDHASGLSAYIERSIPVITTAGNRAFVEGIASAPRTFDGVHPAVAARIELVQGRRTVGSGPNRFELIDVGPNPHADEILIAYFPEHRMMYVPDIYGYVPGFTPPPLLISFAERLEGLGLDVQTVLTAHTDPDTIEGLRAMLERVKG